MKRLLLNAPQRSLRSGSDGPSDWAEAVGGYLFSFNNLAARSRTAGFPDSACNFSARDRAVPETF